MINGHQNIVPSEEMIRQSNLAVRQRIGTAIETYRNSLQELWVGLRDFAVTNCVRGQSGLLRDVEDFCFGVFDIYLLSNINISFS